MSAAPQQSIRLFRFLGITVYLHWFWFLLAALQLERRSALYPSALWGMLEYLGLFFLVLLHEYGHALACRQTGGRADTILLWPLGGVAYVQPPNRPGPILWSIVAGPLVNVILIPVLAVAEWAAVGANWPETHAPAFQLLETLSFINLILLIFNLLPIYPLDGGQILRALLWFWLGEAKSLIVASVIGMAGSILFVVLALFSWNIWLGILTFFALTQAWQGFRYARALSKAERGW